MGYSLKSNMTVFGLGKDKLLGVFLQEVLFFSYTEGYGMSGCKCGLLFFFFFLMPMSSSDGKKRKMRKKGGFTIQLDAENRQRLRQTAADDR